jgi:hypothetical protein
MSREQAIRHSCTSRVEAEMALAVRLRKASNLRVHFIRLPEAFLIKIQQLPSSTSPSVHVPVPNATIL